VGSSRSFWNSQSISRNDDRSSTVRERADNREDRREEELIESGHERQPIPMRSTDMRGTDRSGQEFKEAPEAQMTDESRRVMTEARTPERRMSERRTSAQTAANEPTPLFGRDEAGSLRDRWEVIQATFVDDPKHAVESADNLISEAIDRLSKVFTDERTNLEQQWNRGDEASTEDLRLALQKYRSFFDRLLAA
jgi:hypothetical protein